MRSTRTFVVFALAAFAGCSSSQGAPGETTGQESYDGKVCAPPATLDGVDISVYQKSPDFNALKASGRAFVITRVSDGLGSPDPTFASYYAGIKAAGMIRGAYQFFEPSESATAQANMVLDAIGHKLEPGDLPPTIDMEAKGSSPATVAKGLKTWLDTIEAALHVKPIIYTGYYYWNDNVGNPSGFKDYPLWVAGYPCNYSAAKDKSFCPSIPDEWGKWTFWQYSDGAEQSCATDGVKPPSVAGIGQSCDHDYFNGSHADLMALAGGGAAGAEYAAKFVKQSWPLASAPAIAMTVGETLKGSIDLQNVGTKPWVAGKVHLAPIPRDKASHLASPSWVSPTRVSTVAADVAPGATGHFEWDLTASMAGDFSPYFGLVEDGVTWFADAPLGGGPPDNDLQVHVVVKDAPGAGAGGAGAAGGAKGTGGAAGHGGEAGSAAHAGGAAATGGAGQAGGSTGSAGHVASVGGSAGAAGSTSTPGAGGTSAGGEPASTGGAGDSGAGGSTLDTVPDDTEMNTGSSGGCSTSAGALGGPGAWLLGLAGLVAARRRRRA